MKIKVNGVEVNVERKIIGIDKDKPWKFTVRFYNDDFPDGFVHTVELRMQDGKIEALEGEALEQYIYGFAPMAEFARKKAEVPDLSYLKSMVQEDHVKGVTDIIATL